MAAKKTLTRDVWVPIESFVVRWEGEEKILTTNTTLREGHPLIEKYPNMFRPMRVHYDVEEATDRPGEPRA